ncbi:peptidoglycan editing factor PgeF [Thalassobaculum sp.]|uniref:peptidoglycan editing factor PgeF n=1 Tax=Thalassobaculum sp. TaxID=2022740 RepID=UPI0032EAECB1
MIQIDGFDEGRVRHAFFTRRGGVSGGIYTSLNCGRGSGDSLADVNANRARAMAALDLPASALFTNHQVHSAKVVVVDETSDPEDRREADGLVTMTPNVALGVLAADCAPVLFSAPDDGVIGACHAGWRGAVTGVCEATVDAMIELGARPDGIRAAIGPCIALRSYEVGPEFPEPFLEQDRENARFFEQAEREGHFLFDLSGYLALRLTALGLAEVYRLDSDTCQDEANFFSYRRSCHRGHPDYGRQLAAITLGA